MREYIRRMRETLHQNPEVAFAEHKTAELVASELRRMGFAVKTGIGKTGVVGILRFAEDGPCVAVRADMDALPIEEATGVDFSSQNSGVMHACGHDTHTAIALGICAYLAENQDQFCGSFMAVFQPAEEIVAGAKAMLEDGLFSEVKPDVLFALHNWPNMPTGTFGVQSGPVTAYADRFAVVFRGIGGHGAFHHQTKDPIAMATMGIQAAFSLVQRRTGLAPRALSFGKVQGGSSFNIIPEEVELEGTVRTVSPEQQEEMVSLLHQAFRSAAELYGGSYSLVYQKGVPASMNDEEACRRAIAVIQRELPEMAIVTDGLATLAGEDVSFFLQEVPGALFFFGTGEDGAVNQLHNPGYLPTHEAVMSGYEALRVVVCDYLKKQ